MKISNLFYPVLAAVMAGTAVSFVSNSQVTWVGTTSSAKKRTFIAVASSSSSGTTGTSNNNGGPRTRGPNGAGGPRRNNNQGGGPRNFQGGQRRGPGNGPRGPPRGPGGGPRGPGGGGPRGPYTGPMLRLENPMKIQKVKVEPPQREERQNNRDNNNRGGGGQRGGQRGGDRDRPQDRRSPAGDASKRAKPVISIGDSGATNGPSGLSDKGPKRQPGGKAPREKKAYDKPKRPSLRIGTGKRGRAAEKSQRRSSLKKKDRTREKELKAIKALERKTVSLPEGPLTVAELAEIMDDKPVAIIKFLMTDLGVMASMTQSLDPATCVAVVEGLGRIVAGSEEDDEEDEDFDEDEDSALSVGFAMDEDDPEDLEPRPPVVTIMGHVDHGKTSLLDAIRDTQVTAGEAGGITQHIGAYQVTHNGEKITFIDTPGHAAFTDMRERGANITDIVILVVAADDGVKQQTADSIMCARQAGVPLVVAVNKCDLETADVARVKSDLTGYEVLTEDFGGDIQCAEVSAKTRTGLDDLLDKIMLQAEVADLKANPNREAQGVVVEARVEKGLGTVATTLIQKGTLSIGDTFVAGETWGKVKALIGPDGKKRYKKAEPSFPISVVGFDGVPAAGDILVVTENEQIARELAENRQRIAREKESASYQSGLMGAVAAQFGGIKENREMCVVLKADVQGSAEALARSLSELKLENEEAMVTVKVLVSEAGDVTKSDIQIASVTPDTTVIAFNCAANYAAQEDARMMGIPIEYYNIVYDAIDSVESRMQEVLSPTPDGEYVGSATVQEVFNIGGTGNIAGSRCTDGFLQKGSNVRVMRGDKILCESKIRTLRNFKSEVDKIEGGNECGIGLVDFEEFEPGDVIESYVEK